MQSLQQAVESLESGNWQRAYEIINRYSFSVWILICSKLKWKLKLMAKKKKKRTKNEDRKSTGGGGSQSTWHISHVIWYGQDEKTIAPLIDSWNAFNLQFTFFFFSQLITHFLIGGFDVDIWTEKKRFEIRRFTLNILIHSTKFIVPKSYLYCNAYFAVRLRL